MNKLNRTARQQIRKREGGNMKQAIALSDSDRLAMYRNAFYSKMGVTNQDKVPSDKEVLDWFQTVCAQAEQRLAPEAYVMREHQDIHVAFPAIDRLTRKGEIIIRRLDCLRAELPSWRRVETKNRRGE